MRNAPATFRPDEPVEEMAKRVRERGASAVLVTTPEGRLMGVPYRDVAERMAAEMDRDLRPLRGVAREELRAAAGTPGKEAHEDLGGAQQGPRKAGLRDRLEGGLRAGGRDRGAGRADDPTSFLRQSECS